MPAPGIRIIRGPHASLCALIGALLAATAPPAIAQSFVNWENPHVHPLDITPDGSRLLAVNTADNRLEIFDITTGAAVPIGAVPVGLDPVSVRARTNSRAWVVSHVSDGINIVDLDAMNVVATLRTDDEPADVVFAGSPPRAFVSCSQANTVLVFDPADLAAPPVRILIEGEDPRAMAVSPDGAEVYIAIFESGNKTTILGGGGTSNNGFPPNVVNSQFSPYFDASQPLNPPTNPPNPPPNNGTAFHPPIAQGLPPPPPVGMIVRQNADGQWMDDNNHDWTAVVSGPNAPASGRPVGWTLVDHDVAIIDAATLSVRYATGLMNICMAIAVNPANGQVTVVGTDATNEVRFEPVLQGRFLRVNVARVDPAAPTPLGITDLNPHLTYGTEVPFVAIPQSERDKSLGDPRGIVWNVAGTRAYVTGMGSNNLVVIDAAGDRAGIAPTIEVGEGPTGVVLDESRNRLYVLNKFDASISVVDPAAEAELQRVAFYDPTPEEITTGRKHLYDTHRNSGLGHISCASCHVDARMDRLAWDLGNPQGAMKNFNAFNGGNCPSGDCQNCPDGNCQDWHPMKGPMTTQTLQDIVGKEPHHWRGDRDGIEEFSNAFRDLLGDDAPLAAAGDESEMQEFEDFLATIRFPPNPYRNFNNSLPTNLPLPGHFTTGRFGPPGQPLPPGDAVRGLQAYRTANLDGINCVTCHTLPTGAGTDTFLSGGQFIPLPTGPNGEHHLALVSVDGSTNITMKIPHLRNQYEKTGFDTTQLRNTAGFGFLHDGSVDSIARFVNEPVFSVVSDQQTADLVALMLAFSGSGYPPRAPFEPPGVASLDSHAAVGRQTTLVDAATAPPEQLQLISDMIGLANANAVGLVVKGIQGGIARGYTYVGGNQFQSDRVAEVVSAAALQAAAAPGSELTYTVVPKGSEFRIGVDRDEDTFFDRDELDQCSNPADPFSVPGQQGDVDGNGLIEPADAAPFAAVLLGLDDDPGRVERSDLNCDHAANADDIQPFVELLLGA